MRLVTFNIWNHDTDFDKRIELLVQCIKEHSIDILALQEVRSEKVVEEIKMHCSFKYVYWKKYHDCEEGLAILSNYPIMSHWTNWDENTDVHNSGSMIVEIEYEGMRISVSNVHLDYRYALNREVEIIKLIDRISTLKTEYNLIVGDFNTYPNSSIHGYLTGRQSLSGRSARWIDLGESFSVRNKISLDVTIDFFNNPRWSTDEILDIPGRYDWILLENPYPRQYPKIIEYKLIGKDTTNGITPSDHYGVLCHIQFAI